jgi:hypothetical protein
VALGRWHFPVIPKIVSNHPICNSVLIRALRGAATKLASLAQPSLLEAAGMDVRDEANDRR